MGPVHWNICLEADSHETYDVLRWLDEEWTYVRAKFGSSSSSMADEDMQEHGVDEDSWWWRQITQYIDRARAFGVDTPAGRQALAKATATMIACAGSAVRVHGALPVGGTTSGEVVER